MENEKKVRVRHATASDQPGMVVGVGYPTVPTAKGGQFCSKCGAEVWLASGGRKAVAAGAAVICLACALPLLSDKEVLLPSRAQMIEDMGGNN